MSRRKVHTPIIIERGITLEITVPYIKIIAHVHILKRAPLRPPFVSESEL